MKFAFKTFGADADLLRRYLNATIPRLVTEYKARHDPIRPIQPIPGTDTFYLGYVVQRQLEQRLRRNKNDKRARAGLRKLKTVRAIGEENFCAYLASDHLDVYVATSMREPHEYLSVHDLTRRIFDHRRLKAMKVRWFDPTQAYCASRLVQATVSGG